MKRSVTAGWARHDAQWRDPRQVTAAWRDAGAVDPALLAMRVRGRFWEALARLKITLLVTREYEHLVMALAVVRGRPRVSYWSVPHPSGIAVDRARGTVWIASTRNPNQVYQLAPVTRALRRTDGRWPGFPERPLMPRRTWFYPGSLYLHDLALVGGRLHGNAVAWNAVVRLPADGRVIPAWWPRCVEARGRADLARNHIQLNGIAAGRTLRTSYFTASADALTPEKPGTPEFPVDGRGVVFAGGSRTAWCRGLTRPHSPRLWGARVWVDNSGYGEVGFAVPGGRFRPVLKLPGWTRGLAFAARTGFVATSRVIPRFRVYAPGLEVERSLCGVHAFDPAAGRVLGSLVWPAGNQIFAVDWLPSRLSAGFADTPGARLGAPAARLLSYMYDPNDNLKGGHLR